jgi:hypothetical protein
MQWACMSHQLDSRDLKISMPSHKDVRFWIGVSTGAPLSTQQFLCNPSLMRVMASRSYHQVHSSFKIMLWACFKLHSWACTYLQIMLLGINLQTVLSGIPSNCILGRVLLQIVSSGTFCSSCGAEYALVHLQVMSSWHILFKPWGRVCCHVPSNCVFWCIPFKLLSRVCCHGHQQNYLF